MTATTREAALEAAVARASARAEQCGRIQWVALRTSVSDNDALGVFNADKANERFFWERPAEGLAIAASGVAHVIEVHGATRFAEAAQRVRALFEDLTLVGDPAPDTVGPLLVGGFAFADATPTATVWRGFPAGRLVLPERLFSRVGKQAWWTVVCGVAPGDFAEHTCLRLTHALDSAREATAATAPPTAPSAPSADGTYRVVSDGPHDAYRARVAQALAAIAEGDLEKVVIARSLLLARREPFDAGSTLAGLRAAYPSCTTFAVARDAATFLGATPERLLRLEAGRVEAAALAGSAARGRNVEEDTRLARSLIESKKEQSEHAVVVRALVEALAAHCRALHYPESPGVRRLDGIQHLETPIEGELANGASILELVGELHPTPAVAGAPRDAALAWLARSEPLERGWYAGPIGFVDAAGGGEFALGLRSALLRGDEARLFAGAGIVAGSQPEAELRETRLKLRALLTPLLEI